MTAGTPVLGVDGCRGGWVGALLVDDRVGCRRHRDRRAGRQGLRMRAGGRRDRHPDRAARRRRPRGRRGWRGPSCRPGRKSSVFPTPVRTAVLGRHLAGGQPANRARHRQGAEPPGLPPVPQDRRGRRVAAAGAGTPVLEVHPEVSFAAMGADTVPSKKTRRGPRRPGSPRCARRGPAAAGGPADTGVRRRRPARRVRGGLDGPAAPPRRVTLAARGPRAVQRRPRRRDPRAEPRSSSGWMRGRSPGRQDRAASGGRPPPRGPGERRIRQCRSGRGEIARGRAAAGVAAGADSVAVRRA